RQLPRYGYMGGTHADRRPGGDFGHHALDDGTPHRASERKVVPRPVARRRSSLERPRLVPLIRARLAAKNLDAANSSANVMPVLGDAWATGISYHSQLFTTK